MEIKKAVTLYYDEDSGELEYIVQSDEFLNEDLLMRTDVLQDALGMLERLKDKETTGYFDYMFLNEEQFKKDFPNLVKGNSN